MSTETIGSLPFWPLTFRARGELAHPAEAEALLRGAREHALTDLFVFAHGWNNDPPTARRLYDGFFGELAALVRDASVAKRRPATLGIAGVIWPSIKWPDAELVDGGGGAARVGRLRGAVIDDDAEREMLAAELAKVFVAREGASLLVALEQRAIIDTLVRLLAERPRSADALHAFGAALARLIALSGAAREELDGASTSEAPSLDALEGTLAAHDGAAWPEVYDALADQEGDPPDATSDGGAAGLTDPFTRLWNGAKGALRVTTFYQMKQRAGVVGRQGLGPFLGRVREELPDVRVHLLGHSFGARLVAFALAGLPERATGAASPVKSLFLLQGAFSHFAFADQLPFDARRRGDLAGMAARVDGPLLTTHSLRDTAVGVAYPLASLVAGQDAADARDHLYRWGAMGHDGAQGVGAIAATLGAPGTTYTFAPGHWINLDGNHVIARGGPPAGAHGDIVHPHTAWAALAAAGVVG